MQQIVQQVRSPFKFGVPAFEGDSAASWSTWSQKGVHQARSYGFEAELTATKREGLSIGADVFCGSNVDPLRSQNANVVWMTRINRCSGMALETVQRSEAPNNACGETSNHTIERRELGTAYCTRLRRNHRTRWESFQVYDGN